MPLTPTSFTTEVRKISDPLFENHEGFPESLADSSARWGQALFNYFSNLAAPLFLPTSHEKAKLESTSLIFSLFVANDIFAIEKGIIAYANVLASSPPPGIQQVTVNPAPLIFAEAYAAGLGGSSALVVAELMSSRTYPWSIGCQYTPVGGTPLPWL